jgi:hypothetical protein
MAIDVFKIKETDNEPQTIGAQLLPAATTTDTDGNTVVSSWRREIAVLKSRTMVVQGRGYTREDADAIATNGSSTVLYNGNFHFDSRTVVYDKSRINEADMWRITKTVTITALYVNGVYIAGNTLFATGDEAIP